MTVHYRFAPHRDALAHFLADTDEVPANEVVRFFEKVDRRGPGLFLRDFSGAAVLAAALAMKTEGSA
jgi:hypothetical protein